MTSARRVSPVKLSALLFAILTCLAGLTSHVASARAEADAPIPPSLTTPDSVETSLGTLKFRDGIPDTATTAKVYDQLDLQRGVSAFLNGLRGVSIYAARKGLRDAGVKDNEGVLIFSGLMDSRSLFLTANAERRQARSRGSQTPSQLRYNARQGCAPEGSIGERDGEDDGSR